MFVFPPFLTFKKWLEIHLNIVARNTNIPYHTWVGTALEFTPFEVDDSNFTSIVIVNNVTHTTDIYGVEYSITFIVTQLATHLVVRFRAGKLAIDPCNDIFSTRKENKTYWIQVYIREVHEQERNPLIDDQSMTTDMEAILLA